jgi:hypothetical protein
MSGHHPPLTCDQFKTVLSRLGFVKRPQRSGTTHEDWVKTEGGKFYKVTVDCPKAPFSQELISSMARQAGVTKQTIYDAHFGLQVAAPAPMVAATVRRFEARRQMGTDEFWCVWDTEADAQAFGGSLTYLTEDDALARAEALSANP